uniref:Uncharacterized protein n=1 Tax=Lygus hesperus TaxID=30085 RepID=A0A0K8SAT6_LYGHE
MLGLRTAISDSDQLSAYQRTFNISATLPSDIIAPSPPKFNEPSPQLKDHLRRTHKSYLPKSIMKATHVYVKELPYKGGFSPLYNGPFKVMTNNGKTITLDNNGAGKNISIDRCKPALILPFTQHTDSREKQLQPQVTPEPDNPPGQQPTNPTKHSYHLRSNKKVTFQV